MNNIVVNETIFYLYYINYFKFAADFNKSKLYVI